MTGGYEQVMGGERSALPGDEAVMPAPPGVAEPPLLSGWEGIVLAGGAAAASAAADGPLTALLSSEFDGLRERLAAQGGASENIVKRVDAIAHAVGGVAQTQRLMSEQVRRLNTKLDEVATGAQAGKVRAILEDVLRLSDLVSTVGQSAAMSAAEVLRVVANQVEELLAAHGLTRIESSGFVDYALHQPVECVPTENPADDGRVLRVCRPGFRLGERVVRPATVVIAQYQHPAPTSPSAGT